MQPFFSKKSKALKHSTSKSANTHVKVEEIQHIPEANVLEIVQDFESEGASNVEVLSEKDEALFTIKAEFSTLVEK